MNLKTCIYCSQSNNWSKEHCLPRGLGKFKNHQILDKTICKLCNNLISKAEEQFIRVSPVGFFRYLHGVKGQKHHKKVSPFYRGSAGASPIKILYKHPEYGHEILWGMNPGTNEIFELHQIVMKLKDGKTVPILLPEQIESNEKIIQYLTHYDLQDAEPVFFSVPPEEWDKMVEVLRELWPHKIAEHIPCSDSKAQLPTTVRIGVTNKYFRAVAKIGFHYFLKVFSHRFSGEEPEFEPIRLFIYKGEGEPENFVRQTQKQLINGLGKKYIKEDWCHYLTAEIYDSVLISRLQFFVCPLNIPPVHEVILGHNKSKILFKEGYGHSYNYFVDGQKEGFDGEVLELESIKNIIIPK